MSKEIKETATKLTNQLKKQAADKKNMKSLRDLMTNAIENGSVNDPKKFAEAVSAYAITAVKGNFADRNTIKADVTIFANAAAGQSGKKPGLYIAAYHKEFDKMVKASEQKAKKEEATKDKAAKKTASKVKPSPDARKEHVAAVEHAIKVGIEDALEKKTLRKEYKSALVKTAKTYLKANNLKVSDHALGKLFTKVEKDIEKERSGSLSSKTKKPITRLSYETLEAVKTAPQKSQNVAAPKPKQGPLKMLAHGIADGVDSARASFGNKDIAHVRAAAKDSTPLQRVSSRGTLVYTLPGTEATPAKPAKWTDKFKLKLNPKNWVKQAKASKQNTPGGRA